MKKKLTLIIAILLVTMMVFTSCDLFKDLFGSEVTYTVTLDANGGQLSGENTITVKEQSMVDLPSPKREGYVFLGWYLGEGANEAKFSATDIVTSDITLKAKWMSEDEVNGGVKIEIHTVTLNANGGTLPGESIINAQTYSTLNLPTPTKEGYVFIGWYVGEGVNESLFTSSNLVTSDLTLNAKWEKAEHTVTFLDYYGEVISRETVKHGEAANGPTVPRVDEKCLRFDAWDTDVSAVTSDMTVKALYVLDAYTITYVTNNSQTIPSASYLFDQIPAVPPSPGLEGHYFIGWYLDEEFTNEYKFDAPLTSNITLYAYYNESIPISTLEELLAIPEYSSSNYFLKNDIDCEGAVISTQINGFTGTFDGGDHKIYNFVFQPAAATENGLFSTNGGTIKNISFDNFSYTLTITNINSNTGFVVGNNSGNIENVHITNASFSFTSRVDGSGTYNFYYGGIAGRNSGSVQSCSVTGITLYLKSYTISNRYNGANGYLYGSPVVAINGGSIIGCSSESLVTLYHEGATRDSYYSGNISNTYFGGIASVNNGNINDCNAKADVTSSSNNYRTTEARIGGLVSDNRSEIKACSSNLKTTLNGTHSFISTGGFAESNTGTIMDSYANIEATNSANNKSAFGGFVGYNYAGIYKCYSEGSMNVGAATVGKGGFSAYNDGSINSCFADVSISATDATKFGPFVGSIGTASYITNCYYNNTSTFTTNDAPQLFDETYAEATYPLNLTDRDFIVGTLGWSEKVWECDPNKLNHPTLK